MVLVFKFQFGEEIRRVTAERELSFNEVIDLAKTLFRGHLPASIALKYKDDEGDIITVGTQRELEEAYRVSKDKVLRFMITEGKIPVPQESTSSIPSDIIQLLESTLKQVSQTPNGIQMFLSSLLTPPLPSNSSPASANTSDNTTNSNNNPPIPSNEPEIKITVDLLPPGEVEKPTKPLHPARCDSCQKQIRGIRYKCKDCPDFDLCEACEPNKAGIHSSQHSFMKIFKPLVWKETAPEPPKTQPTPPPQYPAQVPAVQPEVPAQVPSQATDNKDAPVKEDKPAPVQDNQTPVTPAVELQPTQPVETPKTPVQEKPSEIQIPQPTPPVDIPKPATPKSSPKPEPKVEPKKVEEKKPELFAEQQRKLEDMGFTDKSRNLALLIQENGNLLEVVKHLLDG
mmetsp:Transcript_18933/g.26466  ORF Transcript_18933/g.26466 Transcript_18933/m.26466 type:complete len:398 (+) Transcript_18933:138-1331(+)